MSSRRGSVLVGILAFAIGIAGASMAACVGDEPTAPVITAPDASEASVTNPPARLAENGVACKAGTECATGQCIDGYCCESKCSGTCERCDIPGSLGKCEAVPDGQDPDTECPTAPLATPDAGAPTDPDAGDAGDAGVVDAGPSPEAGPPFNAPDGGVPPVNANQCAGHCNGKRACAYAGKDVTCGVSFCGNKTEQGHATCDGAGHCLYGVEECSAYACPDGSAGCKASCVGPSDCLAGFFCEGTSHTCKARNANGSTCGLGIECQTGYCTNGVCCNSDCQVTGGTCAAPGKEGQCQCSACPTGPCDVFYKDADGDTYGDANGTIALGTAKLGCVGAPPLGFVSDHTDCLDTTPIAAAVHPGQTAYFDVPYTAATGGAQSFDYDCSGQPDKESPEVPACGFCRLPQIQLYTPGPIYNFCFYQTGVCNGTEQSTHFCSGCSVDNAPSFESAVPCGTSGYTYTCSKCTAKGDVPYSMFAGSKTQRCR